MQIANWLTDLTARHRSWGFGLCYLFLRNGKGFHWDHKRIYQIYFELKLNLRIKPKQRIIRPHPAPLVVPDKANHIWSMAFLHDQLSDGGSFRTFNVIDDFNREALILDVDFSLTSERVVRSLEQHIEWRGKPACIRCDNGPEYLSIQLQKWTITHNNLALYPAGQTLAKCLYRAI